MISSSSFRAKLHFRHGAMSSAKTLNLLAVAHTYKLQGKSVLLLKPALDTRFGAELIKSRTGLQQPADFLIHNDTNLLELPLNKIHCILVDESQFLLPEQVEQLRLITLTHNITIFCYGLRTDFRTKLFPGSQRLLELADDIEEISTTCHFCHHKAILNVKYIQRKSVNETTSESDLDTSVDSDVSSLSDNQTTTVTPPIVDAEQVISDLSGPSVQLGAEELFLPTCFNCYRDCCNRGGAIVSKFWGNEYYQSEIAEQI